MLLNFTPCTLNVSLSGSWTNQRWPRNVNVAIALIQAYPDIHVHQTGFQLHLWSFWGHSDPKTQLVFSVGVSQSDSRSQKGWRWSSVWDKYDTYLWINPLWSTLKKQTHKQKHMRRSSSHPSLHLSFASWKRGTEHHEQVSVEKQTGSSPCVTSVRAERLWHRKQLIDWKPNNLLTAAFSHIALRFPRLSFCFPSWKTTDNPGDPHAVLTRWPPR